MGLCSSTSSAIEQSAELRKARTADSDSEQQQFDAIQSVAGPQRSTSEVPIEALPRVDSSSIRATSGSNLFCEADILQNVLSFVGAGHHFFLAAVSRQWREQYSKVASKRLHVQQLFQSLNIICSAETTLYSSVFSSPAHVQLAHQSGLDCTTSPTNTRLASMLTSAH